MKTLLKIQQDLHAPKAQRNEFGKYNYRSAEDILQAVKPLLKANNAVLTLSDEIVAIDGWHYIKVTATLLAEDGPFEVTAWAREAQTKKGMDPAQITGAASSYARKYALNGLLAIDDTRDPDATNEHDKGKAKAPEADVDKLVGQLEHAAHQSLGMLQTAWKGLSPVERKAIGQKKLQELKAQCPQEEQS